MGCNITLTTNTWVTRGLVNGSNGIIKNIIYPDSELSKETIPETIVVFFPKYVGPQFFEEESKYNWIPLNPRNVYSKRSAGSRTQSNLRLAYAITTPKVQGETLESGVICFGKTEKSLGQAFVQISRFKKLDQVLIEPFPFSRLQKIKMSVNFP